MSGVTQYKLRSGDPEMFWSEINRVFGMISDRLDRLEGIRGTPKFYESSEFSGDVVLINSTKGIVLSDGGSPANYWRVTLDSSGRLRTTNLGRSYS